MSTSALIFLTGFSGSGKSTTGKILAQRLSYRFIDLDSEIEKRTGMSVSDTFAVSGETHFRRLETLALQSVCTSASRAAVIALGGGTLLKSVNRNMVRRSGISIYLECSQTEIYRRIRLMSDRPLLSALDQPVRANSRALKDRIRQLLSKRREYYKLADITISTTNRSPRQVASLINACLK